MALEVPSRDVLAAATQEEISRFVGPVLEYLREGRLPPEVFVQVRRLARLSTHEVVAFETGTDGGRVLIGQRGADPGDKWWVGRLNLPGSVLLPTAVLKPTDLFMSDGRPVDIGMSVVSFDITTPTDTVLETEFKGSVTRTAAVTELTRFQVESESGKENKTMVWTEAALKEGLESPVGGAFFDTEEIIKYPPENLIRGHHYFVERALEALQAQGA